MTRSPSRGANRLGKNKTVKSFTKAATAAGKAQAIASDCATQLGAILAGARAYAAAQ